MNILFLPREGVGMEEGMEVGGERRGRKRKRKRLVWEGQGGEGRGIFYNEQ